MTKFSIITVNYRNWSLLTRVLARTMKTLGTKYQYEIIVVDNASPDDSFAQLTAAYGGSPIIRVVRAPKNGGFGFGCNLGAGLAQADILWFLNSDAWVKGCGDLNAALELAAQPGSGIIGTTVLLDGGQPSPQGGSKMNFSYMVLSSFRPGRLVRRIPPWCRRTVLSIARVLPGSVGQYAQAFDHGTRTEMYASPGVGGASFLMERTRFFKLGGFDEEFFLYDEDGDLCLRALDAGLTNYVCPTVRVETYPSATTSKIPSLELKKIKYASRLRFVEKHFSGFERMTLTLVTKMTWKLL